MIQNLWRPSSLVMRPGFMVTTQKQNSNLPNGSIRNHHDPKKHGRFGARWKWCWPVFFDSRGIVHHEYAPEGQTINKEYYLEVLRRLRAAVQKKRPDMWRAKNFQLHHDNAPAHSAHVIQDFLAKNGMPLVRQAPYSPDLAPCDFWLFPTLKTLLKESGFSHGRTSYKNRRRS